MHELLRSHGFVRRAKEADGSSEKSESVPDQAETVREANVDAKARAAAARRRAKTVDVEASVVCVHVDASFLPL